MADNSNLIIGLINLFVNGVNEFGKNLFPNLNDQEQGRLRMIIYSLFLAILLICSIMVVFVYERVTNHIFLTSIERKVAVLNQLAETGILSKSDLKPLYRDIAKDLSESEVVMINGDSAWFYFSVISIVFSGISIKFLSGATLGLVFFIVAFFSSRNGKKEVMIGSFRLLLFFGILGIIISTWLSPLITFALLTIVQLVYLIFIGRRSQKKLASNKG
ncbi:MAG: hypothetical protein KJZ77_03535 [Anaerolineales bacterium]|nr:hypothetical protein [Anaerolineales bacterium]